VLALALAGAPPVLAGLGDEVGGGEKLARQLEAGDTNCEGLGADEFEQLGEYAMDRMAGSLQLHRAMNERMRSVMGADSEVRMHVLMGRRYAGCASRGSAGMMMGGQGWSDHRAWGSMMRERDWQWMRDGNWQHMDRRGWEGVSNQWMGPGMMGSPDDDWGARDDVLIGVVVLLVAGVVVAGLASAVRRRRAAAG
jgi:hypothetical protein